MNIESKLKINSLFLDTHQDSIYVVDSDINKNITPDLKHLDNRLDIFKFTTCKNFENNYSSFFNLSEYESVFYNEISNLNLILKESPELKVYISIIGKFKLDKYDIFNNIIVPKLIATYKNNDNIILLWDPENVNKTISTYWGFLDVQGKYNLFNKTDPAVPFSHDYAIKYYMVDAYDKNDAIDKIKKEGDLYVVT